MKHIRNVSTLPAKAEPWQDAICVVVSYLALFFSFKEGNPLVDTLNTICGNVVEEPEEPSDP